MAALQQALDFIAAVDEPTTLEDIDRALRATLSAFDIDRFTLIAMAANEAGAPRAAQAPVSSAPDGWREHYWDSQYFNIDAAAHLALQRWSPFTWTDLEQRRLPKSAKDLFSECREVLDVNGGLVLPAHDENGFAGLLVLYHEGRDLPPETVKALRLIAMYSIAATADVYTATKPAPSPCPWTAHQRSLISFSAAGKSDWDISTMLGVSEGTINKQIETAKAALGVKTRAQAIAYGVARGWISL